MRESFHPKVSIIIPVFNGANYMREAIDSALLQTYNNIEVLVINDGSNDEGATDTIARSYGDKIRYFCKENGGVATSLNLGIEKMEGEYFSWLSHDDLYKPEKVEKQIAHLQSLEHNTILYSGYELMDESSKTYATIDHSEIYLQKKLDVSLFPVLRGLANGCTMLIHKSHFDRVGYFDPSLPTTQDYELWFKMFRDAKVRYLSDINVKMRQHRDQGSKVIGGHIEECNRLWISFINRLTVLEMCQMEDTPQLFLLKTLKFLENSPYVAATEYCKRITSSDTMYKQNENMIEKILHLIAKIRQYGIKGSIRRAIQTVRRVMEKR
ncbi:MAG TPA: glycosyltransferase [Ruminiclostridium sp.]